MSNNTEYADYKQPDLVVRTIVTQIICQSPGGAGGHGEQGQGDDPLEP